jgi:hypothetical protein
MWQVVWLYVSAKIFVERLDKWKKIILLFYFFIAFPSSYPQRIPKYGGT